LAKTVAKSKPTRARRSRSATPKKATRRQPAPPATDRTHATLAGLVESLGADVFHILTAPFGLEVRVTEPIIYDALEPSHLEPGDLVLAVGLSIEDRQAARLISDAAAASAAGVIFKRGEEVQTLVKPAEEAGVALISVEPEMTWNQLHALLKTAIAASGEVPESGADSPVGDLFSLANAVSAMVGGPATIEDPQSRVLAFSSLDEPIDEPRRQTILGRRVPQPWIKRLQEHGVFKELWSTEDIVSVELPYKGLRRRLAIAVRSGGEILGSLWVAEGRKHLDAAAEEALREAARIAALHLIRHRASEDLERRRRAEVVRSILEGQGPVEHLASRLGIDAKSPFTVIAFELPSPEENEPGMKRQRAMELAAIYCETFHRRASSVSIDGTIYSLLPTPNVDERNRVVSVATRVVQQADTSLRIPMHAGIGSTVPELRDAPHSRAEADRVLRILAKEGRRSVAGIEDVQAQTLLLEFQDIAADNPHLRSGKVEALHQHDAQHNTFYVETLRAYLDAFGDVAQAASSVNVHPNTFRYRVKRLSELSGIDLNDPDERLAAEIQLRFL
jgi:DNA-binding PucR family transcriptional regulator